jgi:type I restriction enzyme S subunit
MDEVKSRMTILPNQPPWEPAKIRDIVKRVRKPVTVEANKKYREIGIYSHGKGIFHKEERTGASLGNKSVFWVEPDCFVVNIVFAWEQAIAKTTAVEQGMIASHRFPMYKPKDGILDLDYLVYFFKTPRGKYLLGLASPGGAGRNKTLGQEAFLDLSIPLPPYSEQKKIAEILGEWDQAITLTERLIAAKQRRKKGLMQQLLTGKWRFGEFDREEWQEIHIEDAAEVIMGQSPDSTYYNETGDGLPLIQGNADIIDGKTAPRIYTSQITKRCRVGDIILSVRAPVGDVAYSEHDACIGRGVCAIRAKEIDTGFLYQFLIYSGHKWSIYAQGSTFTAINSKDIRKFKVTIPIVFKEQRKIAAVLQTCDEEIDLLKQKLAALKRQKRGLMQQLLAGQVRVSEQPSPQPLSQRARG